MITVLTIHASNNMHELRDFLKSISSQISSKENCEIISSNIPVEVVEEFSDRINFSSSASSSSRIELNLPDNCLVLGRDWDKYVLYNLDNKKPIDAEFLKRRMGLVSRPDNGVFPGLGVRYPEGME